MESTTVSCKSRLLWGKWRQKILHPRFNSGRVEEGAVSVLSALPSASAPKQQLPSTCHFWSPAGSASTPLSGQILDLLEFLTLNSL